MKKHCIGIYTNDKFETLVNIVETIKDAAAWCDVTVDSFYKAMHIHGRMAANGYVLELILKDGEDK